MIRVEGRRSMSEEGRVGSIKDEGGRMWKEEGKGEGTPILENEKRRRVYDKGESWRI